MQVVIVGSSGGIGAAVVSRLNREHMTLGIDREEHAVIRCSRFMKISLDSEASINEAVNFVFSSGGTPDAVVFTAGTYPRLALDAYDCQRLVSLFWDNFFSVFMFCRAILPAMAERGSGKLVIVSSQASVTGGYDAAYAASKGALQSFMKSIAREYGPKGVCCNSVSPGPVESPMSSVMGMERKSYYRSTIPIGRLAEVSEVAELVGFLLESGVGAINGATFDIDGGLVRR